jgi:nucleotide-binding universal stress UspA family protein
MIIVCATDFSDLSTAAERHAVELAAKLGAKLVFAHVTVEAPLYAEQPLAMRAVPGVYEAQREWAARALHERAATASERGVSARTLVKTGVPFKEIVDIATDESADMIVMGTHGRSGLAKVMLGSVASQVVRHAPCAVLTVGPRAVGKS